MIRPLRQRMAIVDGVRTPFCKSGGVLAKIRADELGRSVVNSLLTKTGVDTAEVDEVIVGCVCQPAEAANLARVIALRSGVPEATPAVTVHRNCASGFEAITQAYERFAAGRGEVFIVAGVESMSNAPLLFNSRAASKFGKLARAKTLLAKLSTLSSFRPADFSPKVALRLGLTDPVCDLNMGETAENLVRDFHVTREEQDTFAMNSHLKAAKAWERGILREEVAPVYPESGGVIKADDGIRAKQNMQALAKLRPVFQKAYGTVTAGNASQITDGAVALLMMSEERAHRLGLKPMGYLNAYEYAGCDPSRMGLGPVHSISKLMTSAQFELDEIDLFEINEAFASQVLACLKAMESDDYAKEHLNRRIALGSVPEDKLNVNGGAIAIGHPVGASGARLSLTALKELARRGKQNALVSACVGGGQGAALWLEGPDNQGSEEDSQSKSVGDEQ